MITDRRSSTVFCVFSFFSFAFFLSPFFRSQSPAAEMTDQDRRKQIVAYAAVDKYVKTGMRLGLGTGSTATFVVERIGQLQKEGKLADLLCVPTSEATRAQAEKCGIPLTTLDGVDRALDLCIDGADEILLPSLMLVKGRGGALLREKMVAAASKTFLVVADESKLVEKGVGSTGGVPVEITKFSSEHTRRLLENLPCAQRHGGKAKFRLQKNAKEENVENRFVTDNGNFIVDLHFETPVEDIPGLHNAIKSVVGVVETGLFIGMASACMIAKSDGSVQEYLSETV
ncbi:ribulose 5-phosphate isomerase [Cystoisospora suis]|uniref:ribose-5-phosphate isomerase n=1 Tax=Cystoisospora suis TaxID=483139 RepID=A0A2C6L1Q9_9APIC|nr:ribulose 5-phosphate isomerase [Cystoisospora suis]